MCKPSKIYIKRVFRNCLEKRGNEASVTRQAVGGGIFLQNFIAIIFENDLLSV